MTFPSGWSTLTTLLLYAAAVAALVPPTTAAATHGSGDGTYYWSTVHGACALSPRPPQYAGRVGVAIATGSYGGDAASLCGACLSVTTTGEGSGANPLPPTFDAYVMDECPTCGGAGDLDVARPGDGRWRLSWRVVDSSRNDGIVPAVGELPRKALRESNGGGGGGAGGEAALRWPVGTQKVVEWGRDWRGGQPVAGRRSWRRCRAGGGSAAGALRADTGMPQRRCTSKKAPTPRSAHGRH